MDTNSKNGSRRPPLGLDYHPLVNTGLVVSPRNTLLAAKDSINTSAQTQCPGLSEFLERVTVLFAEFLGMNIKAEDVSIMA